MKKTFVVICLIFMLINTPLYAQKVSKVGTTAAGFLNIDVGARPIAMGGAFVAIANDVSAMYWNPAGIALITNGEAMFSHTKWIADISMNYVAAALQLANMGTIGVNATFLTMDEMEMTTINDPDGAGVTFDAGSYAFGLAYAGQLTDRFSIGFNFKYIDEYIYNSSAQGFAFDVGTLFKTQYNGLNIGMSISNYGTKMQMSGRDLITQVDVDPTIYGNNSTINANLNTESYDLPLMFRVGLAMDLLKGMKNSNLIFAIDALHPSDDVEYINVGGEYMLNNMFFLRAGYKSLFADASEEGLCFGAGFNYDLKGNFSINIDYAYQDFGILNEVQMFTVGMRF